jgi:hypothetical protein
MSRGALTLTENERFLLNHYTNIYNEQLKSIDLMYNELKETRDIIDYITRVDERPRRNNNINNDINNNINNEINNNINNTQTFETTGNYSGRYRPPRTSTFYRWDYYIPIDDLESVPIVPSQEDIHNNTRDVSFNNIISPLNASCPITLEQFNDNSECTQIIGCGHLFSHSGLQQWLRGNARCPICRYDIRTTTNTTTDATTNATNNTTTDATTDANTTNDNDLIDASLNVLTEQIFNSLFSNRRSRRNSS